MTWEILDCGASRHFLTSVSPTVNKQIANNPLIVQLPNGVTVSLSHTGELDLPLLPKQAQTAHIMPGVRNHSLVLDVKLYNAGCKVKMIKIKCKVQYQGKTVVICSECTNTGFG